MQTRRESTPYRPHPVDLPRPRIEGRFLFAGEEKFLVRGVTYGPFGPDGREFANPARVDKDFHLMRLCGINAIRTYTLPPGWLLDAAARHGLRVMAGLAWEQHVAFLEDPDPAHRILSRARTEVDRVRGHPSILCYAVGNEIPAPIVRWHGPARVEAFLERLYRVVKEADPGALVTYVNYPTTEYLAELPFLDFLSFNVYLEREGDFRKYLARLQNLAGDRPLLMAELGMDARSHGEDVQAEALDWQIRAAFEGGCAGAMVFSWTDEWYRGGEAIREWAFGITTEERRPKPALHAVRRAFRSHPFAEQRPQPFVSVVVCSYNGAATIRETLEHLSRLRYPAYEVIVVDDGSTDATSEIASEFDVHLIRTSNRGLSRARNTGLAAASGEIVAYIDDDAFPDPDWLTFLAATFGETDHVGVGGPNVPPADDGFVARCVARAPGGPIHVLLSDTEAEHLPGCNMAFRVDALRSIGGFDPRFRSAGDDVDVCWGLQEKGWTLGFNPAAVVQHRRRDSVQGYWRQQRGYGRAEAMLERKWPEKYNPVGHVSWSGRLYNGPGWGLFPGTRRRIYQGTWGSAPFQRAEDGPPGVPSILTALPETWGLVGALSLLGGLGVLWSPLLWAIPVALLLAFVLLGVTLRNAWSACRNEAEKGTRERFRNVALTAWLHFIHPVARLTGRMSDGLAPWRRYVPARLERDLERTVSVWSEMWRAPEWWLRSLEEGLRNQGILIRRGGAYDRWDLEARSGALGFVRILMAVEEHGRGRQLARFRFEPRWGLFAFLGVAFGTALALSALLHGAWIASLILGGVALLLGLGCRQEHAAAMGRATRIVRALPSSAVTARQQGERTHGEKTPKGRRPWARYGEAAPAGNGSTAGVLPAITGTDG
jgi:O-antigen biosynthesis protein